MPAGDLHDKIHAWVRTCIMPLIMMYSNLVDIGLSADAYIISTSPTVVLSADIQLNAGENASDVTRTWIKPNFTLIPAGRTFTTAVLNLIVQDGSTSSNARTLSVYRCLRAVNNSLISWNKYSASSWATAGAGNSTTDYDGGVLMGSVTVDAAPAEASIVHVPLDAAEFQKLYDGTYTNNGLIFFVDTETSDRVKYWSTDTITASNRPSISIAYT